MTQIECTTQSADETIATGRAVGTLARAGDIVALIGDLGAGKTQFTRGVAQGMRIPVQQVASPTYVLMHEYESPAGIVLVHIDAYRLTSLADLESVGYTATHGGLAELSRGAVVLIEWADRLGAEINSQTMVVRIAHAGENRRRLIFELPPSWNDRQRALSAFISEAAKP